MADSSSSIATVSLGPDFEMAYHVWKPAGAPRAGILMLHGFGEHAGRYEDIGRYLASRGYLVVGPDARGHGRSGGKRGHVLHFEQYLDDFDGLMTSVRRDYPGVPRWFVLGHSMGGLLALRFILRHPREFAGVITSNPLLGLAIKVPPLKSMVGRLLSSVWPTLVMGNELDPNHLSRDTAVGRAYMADALVHHQVSTRWFTEMLSALEDTNARAPQAILIPTLFLLSTSDRIADMASSRDLYGRLTVKDKDLRVYEGLYHEIFNEFGKEAIYADLADWLDRRVARS